MSILLAGSTGVIGRCLIPLLIDQQHEVTALVRTPDKARVVEALGAKAVVADALDQRALTEAIKETQPEVMIHQLTAHGGVVNFKTLDDDFHVTNRLRTEATATMLKAARLVGTRRVIVQSFCGWPFARQGEPVKNEDAPLDHEPPASFRSTLGAIRYLEDTISTCEDIDGIVLRYGFLYGPGTGIAPDGGLVDLIRRRGFPIVGNGGGIWSFTHVEDAAGAAVAAVTRGSTGLYNIVDDEPASVATWLPFLAEVVGAKPPRRVPSWLAKPIIGHGGVLMMTQVRGGDNAKAKRELGWQPTYTSWRKGFVDGLNLK